MKLSLTELEREAAALYKRAARFEQEAAVQREAARLLRAHLAEAMRTAEPATP